MKLSRREKFAFAGNRTPAIHPITRRYTKLYIPARNINIIITRRSNVSKWQFGIRFGILAILHGGW